jgi:hypothetical protein
MEQGHSASQIPAFYGTRKFITVFATAHQSQGPV